MPAREEGLAKCSENCQGTRTQFTWTPKLLATLRPGVPFRQSSLVLATGAHHERTRNMGEPVETSLPKGWFRAGREWRFVVLILGQERSRPPSLVELRSSHPSSHCFEAAGGPPRYSGSAKPQEFFRPPNRLTALSRNRRTAQPGRRPAFQVRPCLPPAPRASPATAGIPWPRRSS